MRIAQSRDELCQHLIEQIQFLQNSSKSYDDGFEGEARRLATVMRVLLHDQGQSIALLTSLGIKEELRFYDICGTDVDKDKLPIISVRVSMRPGEKGYVYFPSLEEPKERTSFNTWWNGLMIKNKPLNVVFTRKDIICSVADMDGGAHVDPSLDASYANLSRNNAIGWKVLDGNNEVDVFENGPELPIVRQCANEVYLTLKRQVPDLLDIKLGD